MRIVDEGAVDVQADLVLVMVRLQLAPRGGAGAWLGPQQQRPWLLSAHGGSGGWQAGVHTGMAAQAVREQAGGGGCEVGQGVEVGVPACAADLRRLSIGPRLRQTAISMVARRRREVALGRRGGRAGGGLVVVGHLRSFGAPQTGGGRRRVERCGPWCAGRLREQPWQVVNCGGSGACRWAGGSAGGAGVTLTGRAEAAAAWRPKVSTLAGWW